MLITLVLQYILGITNNQLGKFADTIERTILWRFAFTRFTEASHFAII